VIAHFVEDRGAIAFPWKGEVGAKYRVGGTRFDHTPAKTERARRLRRDMTAAELRLWAKLRSRQVGGHAFRRQHPFGAYVLDFYCPSLKLAIEVDGLQHGAPQAAQADANRSAWPAGKGIRVLRFWNDDVMRNMPAVLDEIDRAAAAPVLTPTRRAMPADLPLAGGGKPRAGEVDRR
jgi:very-short-patch-repair endonuclease